MKYHVRVSLLHERCLRLTFNDKHSTFHEFSKKDCPVSIHTRSLQFLVTGMYKLAKSISLTIMQESFRFWNSSKYNLRSQNIFEIPFRNSVYNGTESVSYLTQKFGSLCQVTWKELTHWPVSKNK